MDDKLISFRHSFCLKLVYQGILCHIEKMYDFMHGTMSGGVRFNWWLPWRICRLSTQNKIIFRYSLQTAIYLTFVRGTAKQHITNYSSSSTVCQSRLWPDFPKTGPRPRGLARCSQPQEWNFDWKTRNRIWCLPYAMSIDDTTHTGLCSGRFERITMPWRCNMICVRDQWAIPVALPSLLGVCNDHTQTSLRLIPLVGSGYLPRGGGGKC
jgi:hypothetical protein